LFTIDHGAPVICNRELLTDSSIERVWARLGAVESWPVWNAHVSDVELQGPLAAGTPLVWRANGRDVLATVREVRPDQRLAWEWSEGGLTHVRVVALSALLGATLLRAEGSVAGLTAFLGRRRHGRLLDESLTSWLEQLRRVSEAPPRPGDPGALGVPSAGRDR
jgi:uncharacterized protein YndB with AHSA1/START domain